MIEKIKFYKYINLPSIFKLRFLLFFIILFSETVNADQNIIFGENNFKKEIYFESNRPFPITNICTNTNNSFEIENIFIFSQQIVQIVNSMEKKLLSEIKLDWPSGILRPDLFFHGNDFIIIAKGPVSKLGTMDMDGHKKWIFCPTSNTIENTMAVGDLDKNGFCEFYVATNIGLIQFDNYGKKKWTRGNRILDVEVFDSLSVSLNNNSIIEYRDYNGNLVKTTNPHIKLYDLELINWPNSINILTYSGSKIYIITQDGEIILSYDVGRNIYSIKGTSVVFQDSDKPYIAILAKLSSTVGKSILCIFKDDRNLFYEEIIDSPSQGILAIKNSLIVGHENGKLFKYDISK